jgi:hypothetical protein
MAIVELVDRPVIEGTEQAEEGKTKKAEATAEE